VSSQKPIYTMDIETDPFKYGRVPKPFVIGCYDGHTFHNEWGENCIEKMYEYVRRLTPGIIYMHNGGRFDFFYLIDWMVPFDDNFVDAANMLIINSRIVKAEVRCIAGKHELRDSFAIMPFALAKYKKDEIDYTKMEAENREQNRIEILEYLKGDCRYLWELCTSFVEMFGKKLTIGSTAMKELQKLHEFSLLDEMQDAEVRSNFYVGGRVECFKKGIIHGDYRVYDVNSMYPYVMRNYKHPIGTPVLSSNKVTSKTMFITVEGKNYGAFARREKNGSIKFDYETGIFHTTIHEWESALSHGLFDPTKIIACVDFDAQDSFAEFVDKFYNARIKAKDCCDVTHSLFYKYVLNSAYGKFAQNPENYFEYQITTSDKFMREWEPAYFPNEKYIIWKRPSNDYKRFNVATGASITGAARAVLLDAIANADEPLYCDTDSIICKSIKGIQENDTSLGAWKVEAKLDKACIAGKKLYALFDNGVCVKQANKGVKLTADEIERLCTGEIIENRRDAPSFRIGQTMLERLQPGVVQHSFITRNVRML